MKIIQLGAALTTAALVVLGGVQEGGKPKAPRVGDAAPTFRLNDQQGRAVSIGGKSEHWTVVAFFPKAMTPG